MPLPAYEFPLAITVLACIATSILLIIMILLFRINSRIGSVYTNPGRSKHSSKTGETEDEPVVMDLGPGSPFEDFLKEDPYRRTLAKKEQFKAYRIWRSEKGLNWPTNWSTKD